MAAMIGSIVGGALSGVGLNKLMGDAKGENKDHMYVTEQIYNTMEIDPSLTHIINNYLKEDKLHSVFANKKEHGRTNNSGIVEPAPGYNHYVYEVPGSWNIFSSINPYGHTHFYCRLKEIKQDRSKYQMWIIYYLPSSINFVKQFIKKIQTQKSGMVTVTRISSEYGTPYLIKNVQKMNQSHKFQKEISKQICKYFFDNSNHCIALISGTRGSGKTEIGYSVKDYIEKKYSNKFTTVNIIMDCDPTQAGLDFNKLIFTKNQIDVCNIIVINEFNKIIDEIGSNKNQYKQQDGYTDTMTKFLNMMDLFEKQLNLIVILTAEIPQENYAYKIINSKFTPLCSAFRKGRVNMVFRIRNLNKQKNNKFIMEDVDQWKNRHYKRMLRKFYRKYSNKKFTLKYNGYSNTEKRIIKFNPNLIKNNSHKENNNSYLKNKKILYILNIFYNLNHFSFLLLYTIFTQILSTSTLLFRDFLWMFTGRKCIFIKKDMSYELKDITNDNKSINFYNNIRNNGYKNVILFNKEYTTMGKFKTIIWCYYLSKLANYHKNTVQKYFNKTIVLDNYKMIYKNNNKDNSVPE
jgi:hypothetical protein